MDAVLAMDLRARGFHFYDCVLAPYNSARGILWNIKKPFREVEPRGTLILANPNGMVEEYDEKMNKWDDKLKEFMLVTKKVQNIQTRPHRMEYSSQNVDEETVGPVKSAEVYYKEACLVTVQSQKPATFVQKTQAGNARQDNYGRTGCT